MLKRSVLFCSSKTLIAILMEAEVKQLRQYLQPLFILIVFEAVAVTLWLTKNNIFYLFNFSYIGLSISLGIFLFINKYKYARRIVQLLVGLYMLVYLGLICRENMQIEGFWYYLFTGVFEAATIHYAVAKIFGPLVFGRGWCGYACWTAMVLDFLPYKVPTQSRKKSGWIPVLSFRKIQASSAVNSGTVFRMILEFVAVVYVIPIFCKRK